MDAQGQALEIDLTEIFRSFEEELQIGSGANKIAFTLLPWSHGDVLAESQFVSELKQSTEVWLTDEEREAKADAESRAVPFSVGAERMNQIAESILGEINRLRRWRLLRFVRPPEALKAMWEEERSVANAAEYPFPRLPKELVKALHSGVIRKRDAGENFLPSGSPPKAEGAAPK